MTLRQFLEYLSITTIIRVYDRDEDWHGIIVPSKLAEELIAGKILDTEIDVIKSADKNLVEIHLKEKEEE